MDETISGKARRAFREVLPIDHYWREMLAGMLILFMVCCPFIYLETTHGTPLPEAILHILIPIQFMAMTLGVGIYAFMRLAITHPIAERRRSEFMALTPWTAGRRLPWGTPRLCWQDAIALLAMSLAGLLSTSLIQSYRQLQIPAECVLSGSFFTVLIFFTSVRGLSVLLSLWAASPLASWLLLFLFPLLTRVALQAVALQISYYWLIPMCLTILLLTEWLVIQSLKQASDLTLKCSPEKPLIDNVTTALSKRLNDPVTFGDSAGMMSLGWPFNSLSPKYKRISLTASTGLLVASWFGWLVLLAAPAWNQNSETRSSLLGFFYVVTAILALLRLVFYGLTFTGPSIRLHLRQWIIPREDRALIAPLLMLLLTGLGGQLIRTSLPPIFLMPVWAFSVIATMLLCWPNLLEHSLTTTTSLRLRKELSPRPKAGK